MRFLPVPTALHCASRERLACDSVRCVMLPCSLVQRRSARGRPSRCWQVQLRFARRRRGAVPVPSSHCRAALHVSRAACIMRGRAHADMRSASLCASPRERLACDEAVEKLARAKAFRKTPSRYGSQALTSAQRCIACHVSRAACIMQRVRAGSALCSMHAHATCRSMNSWLCCCVHVASLIARCTSCS